MSPTAAHYEHCLSRLQNEWREWNERYVHYVQRVQFATEEEWQSPQLQRFIWEDDGVTTIGPGNSVTVTGAYTDPTVIARLRSIATKAYPEDVFERAKAIDQDFGAVMRLVYPTHTQRRPTARLMRVFAGLRPQDTVCLVSRQALKTVRRMLDVPRRGLGPMGENVLLRSVLDQSLPEAPSEPHGIDRAIFAWHLFETSTADATARETADEIVATPAEGKDVPRLKIRRPELQLRGIPGIRNPRDTMLRFVQAAAEGATRDDLSQSGLLDGFNPVAIKRLIPVVRSLGLYDVDSNGEYRPSAAGQQLLDNEEPEEVLAPILIERFFGFAQLLWDLQEAAPEGLPRAEIDQRLMARNPGWTTARMPSSLIYWSRAFGLIEHTSETGTYRLTETGEYWASGIPQSVAEARVGAEAASEDEDIYDGEEPVRRALPATGEWVPVSYGEIVARMPRHLVLPDDLLAQVHAALHTGGTKRFVLLSGLSGTGKTALAIAYAKAYCTARGVPPQRHLVTQAVRPDWTDPSGLLGYFNPLSADARYESTEVLELLLRARAAPSAPFFLILDEMNLARVEHYFAPFLSAMETGNDLYIHSLEEGIDHVPPTIPWPNNLFIFGTVNMDETTHAFSDKVLDRAFTFELWDVDLARWRQSHFEESTHDESFAVLSELYGILHPVRRHFGYRTCNEFMGYVVQLSAHTSSVKAIDSAVLTKVLPKLRGDDTGKLTEALAELAKVCVQRNLERSAAKVQQLRHSLEAHGVVRFFA